MTILEFIAVRRRWVQFRNLQRRRTRGHEWSDLGDKFCSVESLHIASSTEYIPRGMHQSGLKWDAIAHVAFASCHLLLSRVMFVKTRTECTTKHHIYSVWHQHFDVATNISLSISYNLLSNVRSSTHAITPIVAAKNGPLSPLSSFIVPSPITAPNNMDNRL